jgi:mono/diheme cytochrome c family protein
MKKSYWMIILLAAAALLLAACLPEEEPAPTPEVPAQPTMPSDPPPTPTPVPPTPQIVNPAPTPEPDPPDIETDDDRIVFGQELYMEACAACHQAGGEGVVGAYPPMDNNPFVTAVDPNPVIHVIITGRGGMPGFYDFMNVDELAAVVSYIRNGWTNSAPVITEDDIEAAWNMLDFPMDVDEEDDEEEDDDEDEDEEEGEDEDG